MGWLMTIPQTLIALVIVLPIGLLGAWLRRVVTRAYRHDLTGWMALASGLLFALAAATAYWPPANRDLPLTLDDIPAPSPKAGEALVKVDAAGLNYIDVYFRTGMYKAELPLTIGMGPIASVAFLGAIYCAANFGGSITAILINTPGDPSASATAYDGYPMAVRGEAGRGRDRGAEAELRNPRRGFALGRAGGGQARLRP